MKLTYILYSRKFSWGKKLVIFVGKLTSTKFQRRHGLPERMNAVQATRLNEILLTKTTVIQINEFFTPRKLPAIRYTLLYISCCTVHAVFPWAHLIASGGYHEDGDISFLDLFKDNLISLYNSLWVWVCVCVCVCVGVCVCVCVCVKGILSLQ